MKEIVLGGRVLITGRGSLASLRGLAAKRALIVTGGSAMQKSGVLARVEELLRAGGGVCEVFSGVRPNPDPQAVLAGLERMRRFKPDTVVAVGGGSAIDAAKVMALLFEHPVGRFADLAEATLPNSRSLIRLVAIPSTSGTGAEVTKAAVITFPDRNLKIGLKSEALVPDVAILDAELAMTMPPSLVAETGLDAVTHAVECYINPNLDDFTEPLAREAVAGLLEWLPVSYREKTLDSREKVHNYQCMAGLAFTNVGLGMAHGIAHAIGGKFGLGHGLINAIALPEVLAFNSRDAEVARRLGRLAQTVGAEDFVQAVRKLNRLLAIPASFRATGLGEEAFRQALPELVANSLQGSTRVNPVKMDAESMAAVLERLYFGR
ncbi:MAG TPA: iron-containing alcohol dehydrogenase [Selenomonadales bacterium]|nr:iron-containing alcohol dehydrogenase [Selenomonadales bacterium]